MIKMTSNSTFTYATTVSNDFGRADRKTARREARERCSSARLVFSERRRLTEIHVGHDGPTLQSEGAR